jgi:hypothetical protein
VGLVNRAPPAMVTDDQPNTPLESAEKYPKRLPVLLHFSTVLIAGSSPRSPGNLGLQLHFLYLSMKEDIGPNHVSSPKKGLKG